MKSKVSIVAGVLVMVLVFSLAGGCESPFWPQLQQRGEDVELKNDGEDEDMEQGVPFADIERGEVPFAADGETRLSTLYFAIAGGDYLMPVQLAIPETEGIARATLKKLIEGPSPGWEMRFDLQAVLPAATRILGLTIRDGEAIIDLSKEFLDYEVEKERLVLDALVYTLTQFDTVDRVSLIIEGNKIEELPGGSSGGEKWVRNRGINLEVQEGVEDFASATPLTLYFCLFAGEKFFYLPVTRVVPHVDEEDLPRAVLQELLAGPRGGSDLFSDIPPETAIRSVTRENSLLKVDFNSAFTGYRGGMAGGENMLNQISLTLTELPGVEEVKILVDGHEVILPDGISLFSPLKRPEVYNYLE